MTRPDGQQIAQLLRRCGNAHHEAFASTDGGDPEWAIWYAGYLQAPLRDITGGWLSRSRITYLLVRAEREHRGSLGPADDWSEAYAATIVDHLADDR